MNCFIIFCVRILHKTQYVQNSTAFSWEIAVNWKTSSWNQFCSKTVISLGICGRLRGLNSQLSGNCCPKRYSKQFIICCRSFHARITYYDELLVFIFTFHFHFKQILIKRDKIVKRGAKQCKTDKITWKPFGPDAVEL